MTKPYTAIENYLDRTPRELTSAGKELEFSPFVTATVRIATSLAAHKILIDDQDIEQYKEAGTVVVAPTHRSFLDMAALAKLGKVSGEGQPYFMSKRENMENAFTVRLYGKMRTFPIDRDMSSDPRWQPMFLKWGRFVLGSNSDAGEQDMKLVIFPEGTRKDGDIVEDVLPGANLIARRNRVPMLPIGIVKGRVRGYHARPTVVVTVGEPFEAPLRDLDIVASKLQEQYNRGLHILERI